jgi:hypothetical protein|tara:strand:- start:195 stop:491 length:297 start_codon:yes stop_codon:yes gene_type:complete
MIPALNIDLPEDFRVDVKTTQNRGFTPEEIAQRCADKIVAVGDSAPPAIRDQALAYKRNITKIIEFYLREAAKSDRTTVYNAINDAGHPELAELIRRM